jgi:glutaredoxin
VKEFLSRAGHAFTVKNVEDDDAASRELIALGFRTVPTTIIGGQAVAGFNPGKLRAALRGAGLQSDR